LTYDRAVIKVDVDRAAAVNRGDISRIPVARTIVPNSQTASQTWRYSTSRPSGDWYASAFNDSSWREGPGVFGTPGTPGASVRTTWNSPDVWLRRSFDLPDLNPDDLVLSLLHDEDAEIYLNGVLAATAKGFTVSYDELPIAPEAKATLKTGKNTIAIHCHQTGGGQAIDAGLIELK
jgi:hypothetical protein